MMASSSSLSSSTLPLLDASVVEEALQEFRQALHSRIPVTKLKHFSKYWNEADIENAAQDARSAVLEGFMRKVSKLDISTICDHLKELNAGIEESIGECLNKHGNLKAEAEAFLEKCIVILCDCFQSTLEDKLVLEPRIELSTLEKFSEDGKLLRIHYFDNWNVVNEILFAEKKEKLKMRLGKLEREIIEKHRRCLQDNSLGNSESREEAQQQQLNGIETDVTAAASNEPIRIRIPMTEEVPEERSNSSDPELDFGMATASTSSSESQPILANVSDEPEPDPDDESSNQRTSHQHQLDSSTSSASQIMLMTECRVVLEPVMSGKRHLRLSDTPTKSEATSKRARVRETSANSSSSTSGISKTTGNDKNSDSDHSLIFRLATDHVAVGTRVGKGFSKLSELSCTIGIDDNEHLVCGEDALQCHEHWTLMDILGEYEDEDEDSPMEDISFLLGDEKVTRELSCEFFLGFIMSTLKNSAETQLERGFSRAIVTLPLWFCSTARVQIKDAARIAGFSEINLINQETLAAYAHAFRRLQGIWQRKCYILVLSENFGVISAVLYEYYSLLTMFHDIYCSVLQDYSNPLQRRGQVRELCQAMCLGIDGPKKVLFLTQSPEWSEAFKVVTGELGFGYDGDESGVLYSGLFGASLLCRRNQLMDFHDHVEEYQPPRVRPYREGRNSPQKHTKCVANNVAKAKLPKLIECEMSMTSLKMLGKPKFFQENLLNGKMVTLGALEFKREEDLHSNSNALLLTFEITVESMIILACVELKKPGKIETLSVEDFAWTDSSLDDEEKQELAHLVTSVVQSGIRTAS